MNQISNKDVQEFIELLVTLGGANQLDKEMIILEPDGTPHEETIEGKKKPLQILHSGMVKTDTTYIFNPLKTVEGSNPAITWFYQSRAIVLAIIIKQIIIHVVELAVSKDTENYDVLQLLTDVSESCDKLTVSELSGINPVDYFQIFYSRKTRTAEAQTLMFSDDAESRYKLRKKTWTAIRNLIRNLFKLEKDEFTLSKYSHHATILSFPEYDAKLHVMSQIIEIIDPWAKLLGYDLRSEDFKKHLENLESYVRMYAFFTAKATRDKLVVNNNTSNGLPIRDDVKVSATPTITNNGAPTLISSIPQVPTEPTIPPPITNTYATGCMPNQVVNPFMPQAVLPQAMPPVPTMSVPGQIVTPYQMSVPAPMYGTMPSAMPSQVVNPMMFMQQQFQPAAPSVPAPLIEKPVIKVGY